MGNCTSKPSARSEGMSNHPSSAGATSPSTALMAPAERVKVVDTLQRHFRTNERFMFDAALLKVRMRAKLEAARGRLVARQSGGDAPDSPKSPTSPQSAPVPSRSNFNDAASVQQRPTREEKIRDGAKLIRERIEHLRLASTTMKDDGSCQFRSIAHQLHGDADAWHSQVRAEVVNYMRRHPDEFSFLFESEADFAAYVADMARPGQWGDELTLKAASNVFTCTIHVLTSEREHYYVRYRPDADARTQGAGEDDDDSSRAKDMHVFLAYISPIHYNSIRIVN